MTSSQTDRALGSESRFIVKLLEAWNSYDATWSMGLQWSDARPGDLIKLEEVNENDDDEIPLPIEWSDGALPLPERAHERVEPRFGEGH